MYPSVVSSPKRGTERRGVWVGGGRRGAERKVGEIFCGIRLRHDRYIFRMVRPCKMLHVKPRLNRSGRAFSPFLAHLDSRTCQERAARPARISVAFFWAASKEQPCGVSALAGWLPAGVALRVLPQRETERENDVVSGAVPFKASRCASGLAG